MIVHIDECYHFIQVIYLSMCKVQSQIVYMDSKGSYTHYARGPQWPTRARAMVYSVFCGTSIYIEHWDITVA